MVIIGKIRGFLMKKISKITNTNGAKSINFAAVVLLIREIT
jgi:hypothetical protein